MIGIPMLEAEGAGDEGEDGGVAQGAMTATLSHLNAATARHASQRGSEGAQARGGEMPQDEMVEQMIKSVMKGVDGTAGQGSDDGWVEGLMRQLLCKAVLYDPLNVCCTPLCSNMACVFQNRRTRAQHTTRARHKQLRIQS
jgi:hypothetical protein